MGVSPERHRFGKEVREQKVTTAPRPPPSPMTENRRPRNEKPTGRLLSPSNT